MMRSKIGSLAVIILGLLALACDNAPPPRPVTGNASARGRINERAIERVWGTAIPKPDGGMFSLEDFKGKVVLVDIWATWCGPCREQTPTLVKLAKRYRDQGLEVVGLHIREQRDPDEVQAYIKEFGIDYTIGFVENHVTDAFLTGTEDETGLPPIPQLFIFGRDGRLAEHLIGNSPEHGLDYLDRIITEQLAKN